MKMVGDMSYPFSGAGALDYFPCRYGRSRLQFRGPRRDIAGDYIVALGGTETYGRFIAEPWPLLVEQSCGRVMVNLGCVNAGVDVYLEDRATLDIAAGASLRILQIPGAINLTNRFYQVHPRRNDRLITVTPELRTLYPDMDFTEFNFTRHLVHTLALQGHERFAIVAMELASVWRQKMVRLLSEIGGPTILLWLAEAPPPQPSDRLRLSQGMPPLVDQMMLGAIAPLANAYIQVVPRRWGGSLEGKCFAPLETPAALAVPGTRTHEQIAEEVLAGMGGLKARPRKR
jgi:hypothetical protein